ncbi:3-keto-disaccharide hydrolase [Frigoriglobus tundricola]|uniref:Putative large multi-functional protein n=1 Tax=Frigoriglobus tundricola TaxID=2774151 RepID=A0A6M5YIE4_9BACT|nr:DUF1080 domain-containing protein [Frigoriglobus tundricola]QJW93013.1 putative large multi-functional protein [Frigoriglobus tundricola]
MFRPLLAGLLGAGLVFAPGFSESVAQEKKDPPKKKERIAIAEPKDAAKDPDFAVQGEYEGELKGKEAGKVGVQVIANGLGEFTVKLLKDGLPGAGWDGKTSKKFVAVTQSKGVVILGSNKGAGKAEDEPIGSIADGKLELNEGDHTIAAKKVDRKSKTLGEKPPEGAVVLWAAEGDEKNWTKGKLMELSDGKFLTVAKTGSITSKAKFGAFKAHIEFRLPWMPNSTGQGRGNSGVYIQDRYELQVLDSFGLNGENNECGGIYTQHKPLVNMCLPPLVWQTYDIEFTPAVFGADGKKTKNGHATIYHNGVKIHDNIEFPKEGPGGKPENAMPGPFQFQDHGDPVVYRNVWVVEAK